MPSASLNSSLVNFPIDGNVLINKVTEDRFSLVYNTVGNSFFPIGQYIFFTKNNSVWYKYKTLNNHWSNEILYLPNASGSNTKFDNNGYPITAYLLPDNSIYVNYYDYDGKLINKFINQYGILPTIAINNIDVFLFYVPLGNLTQISYLQQFNDFNIVNNYLANIPSIINTMQIETMNDNSFLFSFECDNGIIPNVYIAFSDSVNQNIDTTFNLFALVNFTNNTPNQFNLPAVVNFNSNISNQFDLQASVNFVVNKFDLSAIINFIVPHFDLPASINFTSNNFDLSALVTFNSFTLKEKILEEKSINQFNLPASINFSNNFYNLPASVSFVNNQFNLPAYISFINANNINNQFDLPAIVDFINTSNTSNEFNLNCYVQFNNGFINNFFPLPPILQELSLVNNGTKAFAGISNNNYYVFYNSIHYFDDNIGNYSKDGINWTPNLNNTDPPSHFIVTNKTFNTDCNFYPVFNTYGNTFAIAWIESNPVGRLNLKYSDISTVTTNPVTPTNPNNPIVPVINPNHNLNPINNQTIYVYPNVVNAETFVQTQNIPMSDIQIVDNSNNIFNLDVFEANVNGCELTMPNTIKSLRFSQFFRQKTILKGFVGTANQPGDSISIPLSNVNIIIYYGKTNQICDLLSTDTNGKFTVYLNPGNYVFEIAVNTTSITYSQLIV